MSWTTYCRILEEENRVLNMIMDGAEGDEITPQDPQSIMKIYCESTLASRELFRPSWTSGYISEIYCTLRRTSEPKKPTSRPSLRRFDQRGLDRL